MDDSGDPGAFHRLHAGMLSARELFPKCQGHFVPALGAAGGGRSLHRAGTGSAFYLPPGGVRVGGVGLDIAHSGAGQSHRAGVCVDSF